MKRNHCMGHSHCHHGIKSWIGLWWLKLRLATWLYVHLLCCRVIMPRCYRLADYFLLDHRLQPCVVNKFETISLWPRLILIGDTYVIWFLLVACSKVRMKSINRITQFFSSKEAVSRDVALQTAAALQVRIAFWVFGWPILGLEGVCTFTLFISLTISRL